MLDTHHARDARRVYYLGRPIAQAAADEFEVIAEYHGRDRRHVYDRSQIILRVPLLFKGLLARRGEHRAKAAPARKADVMLLAETLAMGDAEALAPGAAAAWRSSAPVVKISPCVCAGLT